MGTFDLPEEKKPIKIDPVISNRSFFYQMMNKRDNFTSQNYDISADLVHRAINQKLKKLEKRNNIKLKKKQSNKIVEQLN